MLNKPQTLVPNPQRMPIDTLVKKGYKKTKLGWIPEEWVVLSLDEVGAFTKGKGISKADIKEEGLPCIRYAEIYTLYNEYTSCFTSKIDEASASNSKLIEKGDLLFAGSGETLEDIGKCIAYIGDETAYAGGDIIILKQKKQDAKYLGFLLNHEVVNRETYKIGQGHSVVHIYSSGLKKIKIPLPPLQEQQKIAKILSTWDKAITLQKQLITQKQALKKGLMQVLLTGEVRFPAFVKTMAGVDGFAEDWEEVRLGDLAEVKRGAGSQYIKYVAEKKKHSIRLIRITDFLSNDPKFILKTNHTDRFILQNGDLLIAGTGATAGISFEVPYEFVGLVFSYNAPRIRVKDKIKKEFLIYYLKSNMILRQQFALFTGNAQPFLDTTAIRLFKVLLPSIKEQKKIATVLSTADTEIKKLEEQLLQLQDQKSGLMQVLLSGKVRVII